MAYKIGDVSTTFDCEYVIHGLHCTVDEAKLLFTKSDYSDDKIIIINVEHLYATWGKLPSDFTEDGDEYGWWFVKLNEGYKHVKKMTLIITE